MTCVKCYFVFEGIPPQPYEKLPSDPLKEKMEPMDAKHIYSIAHTPMFD
jgi:hypothetical protein